MGRRGEKAASCDFEQELITVLFTRDLAPQSDAAAALMMCWVYDILIHACCGFTYLPIYGQSTVVRCLVVVVGTASYRLRKYLVCLAMTTNTHTHTGCGSHWHACGYYLFIKSTTERRRRQRID